MRKKRASEKQGTVDGLCGIYSLLNFLRTQECFEEAGKTRAQNAFWYLLEAMEAEGTLTPFRMFYGLNTFHLERIFNRICTDFRLGHKAMRLEEVGALLAIDTTPGTIKHVVAGGGAVVCGYGNESHWLLIDDRQEGSFMVRDSGAERERVARAKEGLISAEGLVLIRAGSRLALEL